MSIEYTLGRSQRQLQLMTVLWFEHEFDPDRRISGRELDGMMNMRGSNRHVGPLRIKLRRLGWEIESNKRGYRLTRWKGARP